MKPSILALLLLSLPLRLLAQAPTSPASTASSPQTVAPLAAKTQAPSLVEPSAIASPTPKRAASIFDNRDDLPSLQAAMAQAQFDLDPSPANRLALFEALGRVVNARCLGQIHQRLAYSPNPADKPCQEAIEYTLSINPDSPEAICAKDGLETESCQNAYSEQATSSSMPFPNSNDWSSVWNNYTTSIRLKESETASTANSLFTQLSQATETARQSGKPEDKEKLRPLMNKILDLTCDPVLIVPNLNIEKDRKAQQEAMASQSKETENSGAVMTQKELLDFLKKSAPTTNRQINAVINRVRLVPNRCLQFIDKALVIFPGYPRAICHRDGFFSPNCIFALRKQPSARKPGTKVFTDPSAPLQEF